MTSAPVRLCALAELVDGEARRFEAEGRSLAVVRIGDDVYVIGDRCSHGNVSLSEGWVEASECRIECPKHGSEFDLRTGQALTLPATQPVAAYVASVTDDGDVVVQLNGPS